jgi:hypothetical protein
MAVELRDEENASRILRGYRTWSELQQEIAAAYLIQAAYEFMDRTVSFPERFGSPSRDENSFDKHGSAAIIARIDLPTGK